VGRCIEDALETMRSVERTRPVEPVRVADGLRDLDLALRRDLLEDQRHREEWRKIGRPDRLERGRMQVR
jgi:hypothetical protein